ncbi:MAG TPA: hypothetical protein VL651_02940 [Bacteroidia bacterium]|nr:hypothetical protein [Bacteroidia bacterium]
MNRRIDRKKNLTTTSRGHLPITALNGILSWNKNTQFTPFLHGK